MPKISGIPIYPIFHVRKRDDTYADSAVSFVCSSFLGFGFLFKTPGRGCGEEDIDVIKPLVDGGNLAAKP